MEAQPVESIAVAPLELVILGEPATYSSAGERPWKASIHTALSARQIQTPLRELTLDFTVASNTRRGQRFDLDNMCDPVFAVLGKAGWLDGGRPGVARWFASKTLGTAPGVTIRAVVPDAGHFDLEGPIYMGPLPQNGTDSTFAAWIAQSMPALARFNWQGGPIGVGFSFGASALNVADTARIKSLIDGLWPLIGGKAGAPDDGKVEELFVERGAAGLKPNELQVAVWNPSER